jgi:PAP2 superfamily
MRFAKAEIFVIKLIVAIVAMAIGLSWAKGVEVTYIGYTVPVIVGILFIGLGQFYRRVRIHEPIAASATVFGLSFLLMQFTVALNYMYLPYSFFGFDQQLAAIDASFGFVWSDFVTAVAGYTLFINALHTVYSSSFNQIILVILVLGLAAKIDDLHTYMVALSLGVLICISIWALAPSSSPVAFQPLADEVAKQLNLALNPAIGAELRRLAVEGIVSYPPSRYEGLVGFPSFHTVMLIATVYAVRNVKLVFWPALAWNLAMFPAIMIHGAHNLVDVFGGLAVAAFSIYCAKKVVEVGPSTRLSPDVIVAQPSH